MERNAMETFSNSLFWFGIIALFDGSFGLLFQEKWQKMAGKWNIQKLAFTEILIAFALLSAHFAVDFMVLR